ncbi:hypothetical protein TNCV_3256031 [Trichonephila clavipes]|nr:hypothetical protein TNCV_3256031 [Trichonephila clavipes]
MLMSHCSATRGLLATDLVILSHGQVTRMTPDLVPPLLTTIPHQLEHVGVLDRFSVHRPPTRTAAAGSDVVQSGRPIFDDFFQHLWPYIGNNTANLVFQMVKRLWFIRIDQ